MFVADNLSILSDTPTASHIVLDDFENENEENKEVDESEKINQSMYPNASESSYIIDKNLSIHIIENYRIQYLEYTTPPPEFS
ncbi:hypothetical protein OD91_1786 [Lutibacter sp. Hel_I_33_5]|nr:hypothetical protein OD91_1786 [Lutibacter sp. Hel_I_33_5]